MVVYFATASTEGVRAAMRNGLLGQIVTPLAGNRLESGVPFVVDNCAFGDGYPGDDAYLAYLDAFTDHADRCRFGVAPDVLCDAQATFARSMPMLEPIRKRVGRVAYVAQNGATVDTLPWGHFDALFIGGDTTWKLGPAARELTCAARERGVWTHMGRVNSLRRLRYAAAPPPFGALCDSVDGTYLAFGPDQNLPTLLSWLRDVDQPSLFATSYGSAP